MNTAVTKKADFIQIQTGPKNVPFVIINNYVSCVDHVGDVVSEQWTGRMSGEKNRSEILALSLLKDHTM